MELLVFYLIGIIAVAIVLAWSLLAAWGTFLGLTAIVFLLAFRIIFPTPPRNQADSLGAVERTITSMMKELESTITRGFGEKELRAQKRTFETLAKIFSRKVKRSYGIDDTEFKALMVNPSRLEATIGETELVQLLTNKLKPDVNLWDLGKLSNLISKIEDWRR